MRMNSSQHEDQKLVGSTIIIQPKGRAQVATITGVSYPFACHQSLPEFTVITPDGRTGYKNRTQFAVVLTEEQVEAQIDDLCAANPYM